MKYLRWIGFIPIGFIASVLVTFPIHWLVALITSYESNILRPLTLLSLMPPRDLETLILGFSTPFSIIFFGAWTAPKYRFKAAIILAIIVLLVLGGTYLFALNGIPDWHYVWYSLYYGATPVLNLTGIVTALFIVNHKWRTNKAL